MTGARGLPRPAGHTGATKGSWCSPSVCVPRAKAEKRRASEPACRESGGSGLGQAPALWAQVPPPSRGVKGTLSSQAADEGKEGNHVKDFSPGWAAAMASRKVSHPQLQARGFPGGLALKNPLAV